MICDFAQEYHVLDWRALPLHTAAALAAGLGPGSRSAGARAGLLSPVNDYIAALCADRLALLLCKISGTAPPRMLAPLLTAEAEPEETGGQFGSPEDFEAWRAALTVPDPGTENEESR